MSNNIIKQFDKLKLPIFKEINKVYYGKLDKVDHSVLNELADYPKCAIGSIRERLGIENETQRIYGCDKCKELADRFPNAVEAIENIQENIIGENGWYKWQLDRSLKEKREEYQGLLLETKQHMRLTHKKEIEI